ncbi:MAG: hypothetical protein MUC43_05095 [Pirellula sp.]|jgi:hypothetical protein|nr:hypothetical protein [Pirellula sp.]
MALVDVLSRRILKLKNAPKRKLEDFCIADGELIDDPHRLARLYLLSIVDRDGEGPARGVISYEFSKYGSAEGMEPGWSILEYGDSEEVSSEWIAADVWAFIRGEFECVWFAELKEWENQTRGFGFWRLFTKSHPRIRTVTTGLVDNVLGALKSMLRTQDIVTDATSSKEVLA